MANSKETVNVSASLWKLLHIIRLEKKEISALYIYAILVGLIQLSLPLGIQAIINFALLATGRSRLPISMWVLIFLVVIGVLFTGLLKIRQMQLVEKIQQKIFTRYAFEFTHKIPKFNLKAVDGYYLPELSNRFFDTITLQKSLAKLLLDIPIAVIQLFFGLILLAFYNPVFIVFGLVLMVILYLILFLSSPKGYEASLQESNYKYEIASWIQEVAKGVKVFKFRQQQHWHLDKMDTMVNHYLGARTRHFNVLKIQYISLVFFKLLITATMLVVGGILLIQQKINIGQFIAAEIIILSIITAVEKLIVCLENVYDVLTSVEKVNKVVDKPLETSGGIDFLPSNDKIAIELKDLSYQYGGKSVIANINASISQGSSMAILGPQDSGKSTLLRILAGVYNDFTGIYHLNGIPLHNYSVESIRKHMGVLLQKNDIFPGSLWENLTLGDDRIRPDQILDVFRNLALIDYFDSLPNGFDTQLFSSGKQLSATTVQKILLARTILANPRLLIMDDPFYLFTETEANRLLDYLLSLQDKTIIFSTQDQRLADRCNQRIQLG